MIKPNKLVNKNFLSSFDISSQEVNHILDLATKGKPKRISKSVAQLVIDERREHSRKPDRIRNDIVKLCGDISRIELFARQRFEGWDAWGNEI